jgi:hypothetical protein
MLLPRDLRFKLITAGEATTCGLALNGTAYCTGAGETRHGGGGWAGSSGAGSARCGAARRGAVRIGMPAVSADVRINTPPVS